jgi:hypothetical protein
MADTRHANWIRRGRERYLRPSTLATRVTGVAEGLAVREFPVQNDE